MIPDISSKFNLRKISSEFRASVSSLPRGTIRLEDVKKQFKKHTLKKRSYTTVKTTIVSKIFKRQASQANQLTALDTFNLEITPGTSLGLVGRNGSGKSTLLKLIAGIYRPDSGSVEVSGKISALIELGAGFHPDFTGRENVFLGGVMYGLSKKEIEKKFDAIVAYAQLEDFIDDPVRTYSSGMYMRLGFSLAVHTDPDILLIDEVLAVGDAGFIHRCKDTISEFKNKGKTLVFVTHDLSAVERWCDKAVWLDKGKVRAEGEPRYVIDQYLEAVEQAEAAELKSSNQKLEDSNSSLGKTDNVPNSKRWGSREIEITSVRMLDSKGELSWLHHSNDPVVIEFDYCFNKPISDLAFGIGILRLDGVCVHGTNTDIEKIELPEHFEVNSLATTGGNVTGTCRYKIESLQLVDGTYYLDLAVHSKEGLAYDYHHRMYKFSVRSVFGQQGVYLPQHSWEILPSQMTTPSKQALNQK
jgi:ABC-type polysaccharide/polyol phosphate transport system ATPase subunit